MEHLFGGIAGMIVATLTNPLEVVKTRMQLQGELKQKGAYDVHYRNVFHALQTIAKNEGILALEKGLLPFVCYQFTINLTRLGLYSIVRESGWMYDATGSGGHRSMNPTKNLFVSGTCGAIGAFVATPFFLVKTRLMSQADQAIAVGHQHKYTGMVHAYKSIVQSGGVKSLWRGSSGTMPRSAVASMVQLSTFEKTKEYLEDTVILGSTRWLPLIFASLFAGFMVSVAIQPFDIVATRFFNQGKSADGKGMLYTSVLDCAVKSIRQEGIRGLYKGWQASYFRLGPHSFLLLTIWHTMTDYYHQYVLHAK